LEAKRQTQPPARCSLRGLQRARAREGSQGRTRSPQNGQVALDALAAGMLVTILLDTWRITFGGIVDDPKSQAGLTWAA
jgi:cycloeucalenol cycloisomerase